MDDLSKSSSNNQSLVQTPAAVSQSMELEELRSQALNDGHSDDQFNIQVQELIKSTSRIHAAFLFHSPRSLQPLLLAIGEANVASVETSWQTFGYKLGLDIGILKVINNNQFNNEDPVYNTLLHYVQYEDATIGRIIQALADMGRLDVIMRTRDILNRLSEVVLNHEQELLQSSITVREYAIESSPHSSTDVSLPCRSSILIKPALIPDAPFIMKNVQSVPLLSTLLLQGMTSSRSSVMSSPSFSRALAIEPPPEILLLSSSESSPSSLSLVPTSPSVSITSYRTSSRSPKRPYSKKVMLTFAADATRIASQMARSLRQQRGMRRIGVVVLAEQMAHLTHDTNVFICAAFKQVDYIIPILTEEYMRSVLRKDSINVATSLAVDAMHVPLIYQMMMNDYIRRGCINAKVRCLIPDAQFNAVQNHLIMASPIFAAWEVTSRVNDLAERILSSNA